MNLTMLPRLALVLALVSISSADVAAQSLRRADGSTAARPAASSAQRPAVSQPPSKHVADGRQKLVSADGAASRGVRAPLQSRGGDPITITHSASQAITALNAVACTNNDSGSTTDNQFWRVFDLSEFGVAADFTVETVEWGIEEVTGSGLPETTINLYTLNGAFTRANLTLVGSRTYTVVDGDDLALVSVTFGDVTLSADDVLVVEWAVPDGVSAGYAVFPGTNAGGETGPTYLSSSSCSLAEPVTYASIEFPDVHWVLNVAGTVAGGGATDEVEPNNTPAQAQVLSPPFPVTINGNVEVSDQGTLTLEVPVQGGGTVEYDVEDLFRVTTTAPGMALSLSGLSADVDLALFDDGGVLIAASQDGGTNSESISRPSLAPGTYLIGVAIFDPSPIAPSSPYILTVEAAGDGDPPPAAPAGLTATAGDGSVGLSWTAVSAPDLAGYHVYRATAPFTEAGAATRLTASPQAATTYADGAVTNGTAYYYRVSAVDNGGNESALSNQANATPVSPRPPTVTVSVNRAFGDAEDQQNYRLVALPGAVDVNLGSTLTGETPDDWRAFREAGFDGSMEFSHVECGGAGCRFLPGRGFWLLAENAWAVSDAYATVGLGSDGTYSIPLQRGWNAISNPLEVDVPWQAMVDANGLGQAASLYRWNGTWQSATTFTSARSGEAFYFLNDDASRTMLRVPFPSPTAQPEPAPTASARPEAAFELTLSARVGGTASALAVVSMAPDAAFGLDDRDRFAPPGYFEAVGLAVANDSLHVAHRLRHDARPLRAEGHRYEVILTAEPGEMVEIVPEWAAGVGAYEAVLVNPASGERHALLHGETVRLRVATSATRYDLLVGTSAFVRTDAALPQQVEVGSYPNPFVAATTIRYGLPEPGRVRLAVYNVLGERIALLLDDEARDAGYHTAVWHGANLASGVYFYVLETGARRLTGKMTVVK